MTTTSAFGKRLRNRIVRRGSSPWRPLASRRVLRRRRPMDAVRHKSLRTMPATAEFALSAPSILASIAIVPPMRTVNEPNRPGPNRIIPATVRTDSWAMDMRASQRMPNLNPKSCLMESRRRKRPLRTTFIVVVRNLLWMRVADSRPAKVR
jgi:hypothetical protein